MMNATTVRRHFELRGRSRLELLFRVDRFQRAIEARKGAIVGIEWNHGSFKSVVSASIFYQIPLLTTAAGGSAAASATT